jgi:Putative death-receptor fusion protein (DUF2428)
MTTSPLILEYLREPLGSQRRHKLATEIGRVVENFVVNIETLDIDTVWKIRLLLECTSLFDRFFVGRATSYFEMSVARLSEIIAIANKQGSIRMTDSGTSEEELLVCLLNLRDLLRRDGSMAGLFPSIHCLSEAVLRFPGFSRDVITAAAFVSVLTENSHISSAFSDLPPISEMAKIRARLALGKSPESFFNRLLSFLPPQTNKNDAEILHYALQSIVVSFTSDSSPMEIPQEALTALIGSIILLIDHPVSMVASQASTLFETICKKFENLEIKRDILSQIKSQMIPGRGKNLLIYHLPEFSDEEILGEILPQIFKDPSASSSAGNLLISMMKRNTVSDEVVTLHLIKILDNFSDSVHCIDRLLGGFLSKLTGTGFRDKFLSRLIQNEKLPILPRTILLATARKQGLVSWDVERKMFKVLVADGKAVAAACDAATITASLNSSDFQVSLETLNLLCFTKKTTEPVTSDEIDFVHSFITEGGLLHAASVGPSGKNRAMKALLFFFERARRPTKGDDEISVQVLKFFDSIFSYSVEIVTFVGVSCESALPFAEILNWFALSLEGNERFKKSVVEELLKFGLFSQWEKVRVLIGEVLLKINLKAVQDCLELLLEIFTHLLKSKRNQDIFSLEIVTKLLLKIPSKSEEMKKLWGILPGENSVELSPMSLVVFQVVSDEQEKSQHLWDLMEIASKKCCFISEGLSEILGGSSPQLIVDCRGHPIDGDAKEVGDIWMTVERSLRIVEEYYGTCTGCTPSSLEVFQRVSDRALLLMLSVKHIGAISALQNLLSSLSRFALSFESSLTLPREWLNALTGLVTSNKSEQPGLLVLPPALRRSHGLGLALTGILKGEVSLNGGSKIGGKGKSHLIGQLMEELIAFVDVCLAAIQDTSPDDLLVHALNILHTLIKESTLVTALTSFVPSLVSLGMKAMRVGADSWKVRTAGNLLFVNAIKKLLGFDNEKQENGCPINITDIFKRNPSIQEEFMILLRQERQQSEASAENLLVALIILKRATGLDRNLGSCMFPLLGHRCWQIRKISAEILAKSAEEATRNEICDALKEMDANKAHGILLFLESASGRVGESTIAHHFSRFLHIPPIRCVFLRVFPDVKGALPATETIMPVFQSAEETGLACQQIMRHGFDTPDTQKLSSAAAKVKNMVLSGESNLRAVPDRELVAASLPYLSSDGQSQSQVYYMILSERFIQDNFVPGLEALAEWKDCASEVLEYLCGLPEDQRDREIVALRFEKIKDPICKLDLLLDESSLIRQLSAQAYSHLNTQQSVLSLLKEMKGEEERRKLVQDVLVDEQEFNRLLASDPSESYFEKEPRDSYTEKWMIPKLLEKEVLGKLKSVAAVRLKKLKEVKNIWANLALAKEYKVVEHVVNSFT